MNSITQDMKYRQSLLTYAPEVRSKPCQSEVQQKPVLHLLLACPI